MISNLKKPLGLAALCVAVGMLIDLFIYNHFAELIIILLLAIIGLCCLSD